MPPAADEPPALEGLPAAEAPAAPEDPAALDGPAALEDPVAELDDEHPETASAAATPMAAGNLHDFDDLDGICCMTAPCLSFVCLFADFSLDLGKSNR
jgi:hypothetical protein